MRSMYDSASVVMAMEKRAKLKWKDRSVKKKLCDWSDCAIILTQYSDVNSSVQVT